MSIKNYKEIQELRKLAIEEISSGATVISIEHLKLAEMRVQTAIMAGLGPIEVDKEKSKWLKKL